MNFSDDNVLYFYSVTGIKQGTQTKMTAWGTFTMPPIRSHANLAELGRQLEEDLGYCGKSIMFNSINRL